MNGHNEEDHGRAQIVDRRNSARFLRNPLRLGVHDALRIATSSGSRVAAVFGNGLGLVAWRGGPISAGWKSTAASMVQTSASDISWPMLDVPGWRESHRVPKAVAVVMALKITARVSVACTRAVRPLRQSMI